MKNECSVPRCIRVLLPAEIAIPTLKTQVSAYVVVISFSRPNIHSVAIMSFNRYYFIGIIDLGIYVTLHDKFIKSCSTYINFDAFLHPRNRHGIMLFVIPSHGAHDGGATRNPQTF